MFWILKRPSALVGATYCVLVGVCTAITVAPGSPSPLLSLIKPLMAAVVVPWLQPWRAAPNSSTSRNKWRKTEVYIQEKNGENSGLAEKRCKGTAGRKAPTLP